MELHDRCTKVEPITVTVLDNGKIGIDAEGCVKIIREELLDDSSG